MTKIKITTTQNIEIEYELATIFDRMLAWIIDFIIILAYVGVAILVATIIMGEPSSGLFALVTVPALFYHVICESLFQGQSVGKMALRIKVVRIDGSSPNLANYLLRWVFRILEVNPAVFYGGAAISSIAFSKMGQRFGDMIAGTTVIRMDRKVTLHDTLMPGSKEGYEPLFPEAGRLDDADIGTIRDVLRDHRRDGNAAVLNACANRVCHVLGVKPPDNMSADQFLRFILKDYAHLH